MTVADVVIDKGVGRGVPEYWGWKPRWVLEVLRAGSGGVDRAW